MLNVFSNHSVPDHADAESPATKITRVPWNPWGAVVFAVLVFYGAQIIAAIVISIYPWLHHWTSDEAAAWLKASVGAQFGYILLAESLTLGAIYLFLRRYKQGFASIGLRRPRWRDVVYGLAAVPPYFLLYIFTVGVASALIPGLDINQPQEIGFTDVHGSLALAVTFVSLVVLPPFAEEIVVRGLLYTSFKKALPVVGAVIATSAIFAIAHLPEGGAAGPLYIAALDTFVLSLVLIYLREKTGGLWASITLHAIKNGIAYFILFIAPLIHPR